MKYKLILFDADDTLFDFSRSEKISLREALNLHKIIGDFDLLHTTYRQISTKLWNQFEKGEISKEFLRTERFRQFLEHHGHEGDPHLISEAYINGLRNNIFLIDGAIELCRVLKNKTKIGIVTNGIQAIQEKRLEVSGLKDFIDFVVVSEECGFHKPDPRIFKYALDKAHHTDLSTVLMVGDKLETDIAGALQYGITSCWFNLHKVQNDSPIKPHFEVDTLVELAELLIKD